jgi:hypothetical protein
VRAQEGRGPRTSLGRAILRASRRGRCARTRPAGRVGAWRSSGARD